MFRLLGGAAPQTFTRARKWQRLAYPHLTRMGSSWTDKRSTTCKRRYQPRSLYVQQKIGEFRSTNHRIYAATVYHPQIKSARDFEQLYTSIASISGSTRAKQRYQLVPSAFNEEKLVIFDPLTKKYTRLMFTYPKWTLIVLCRIIQLRWPGGVARSGISNLLNCLPSHTYNAGRPHVWLCLTFVVVFRCGTRRNRSCERMLATPFITG